MPGMHGSCCPCGFRFIPDAQGYTCEGGHHRLNRAGEDVSEEQERRDRARRQQIMDGQDRQRSADVTREKKREQEREKGRQSQKDKEREREGEREKEKQREGQRQKDKEAQQAREEQKQKSDFEKERREALARVRLTLEAPPATTVPTSSGRERRSHSPPPEEPVDELDANPTAMPWLQTPATKQREPELVRVRAKKSKAPWE